MLETILYDRVLFFFQKFDKNITIFGIFFSSLFVIYTSINFYRLVYPLIGFLSLIACIIWFFIRTNASLELNWLNSDLSKVCFSLFFVLFSASLASLYFRPSIYQRPLLFFILISLMVGILTIEIIYLKKNQTIIHFFILFQVTLIGISIAWSQLYLFPGVVGVDPWYHRLFTSLIMDGHSVPSMHSYSKLPLFHLFIVSNSLITGFNYKFATMTSVSLSQIICNVMFIFLIGKFLFNSPKIGLFASLFLVVANFHIFMSYWSIPNSFAAVFFLPIFYLLFSLKSKSPIVATLLSLLFMVAVILTHTVSSMCMAVILFVFYSGFNFYNNLHFIKKISPISLIYSTLFSVCMFSWWSFASGHIRTFAELIKWGFSMDYFISTPTEVLQNYYLNVPPSEEIFNYFGMLSFFSFSFIGCLYMISPKYTNHNFFAFTIVAVTPLFLAFSSLVTKHSIIEERWLYFAQIFLCIPLAVGVMCFSNVFKKNSLKLTFLVSFTIILSFFLILSPVANVDNHTFSPKSSMTLSLKASELQALETTSNIWGGVIFSDRYYVDTHKPYYNLQPFCEQLYLKNFYSITSLVLLRGDIVNKPFKFFETISYLGYDLKLELEKSHFSNIYDCGSVNGYLNL